MSESFGGRFILFNDASGDSPAVADRDTLGFRSAGLLLGTPVGRSESMEEAALRVDQFDQPGGRTSGRGASEFSETFLRTAGRSHAGPRPAANI